MSLMEWSDDMSVGVAVFDEDHKKLMGFINDLHDAMKQGKSKEVMGDIFKGLVDYTVEHFQREEDMFDKTAYPGAFQHKQKHKELTDKALDIQEKFNSGSITISTELMDFLKDWLVNHIQGTDKQYTTHLNENGVS